ncbi:GNAT family N-acetyltransferase [Cohnella lupini]|uniref:RimJ/RimL family protein N-acetyltransferase n=1 Tax=Cohnella lupini TaxID=1294267 RepID=A0A3D9IWU0_9BACL|nr:GNAT family N-acetyltransferase [Cohnella lupini]RED66278.1 RimJ/RimL family protein N-acetyltransferase [Cohnella lupini]
MIIRVLQVTDAQAYQELRLGSLTVNPEAFGSTYEREANFSMETVIERVKPTNDKFVIGAFDASGSLVGIVTFMRDNGLKTVHKGNVYGMYVAPEQRGKGIGKSLMLELLKKAKEIAGLEQINLTVVSDNDSAKKLYESVGFEAYGVERNAMKFEGRYFDEDFMVWINR